MASDAGVRNIEQLAQFGKNIKNLGQNMYQTRFQNHSTLLM